MEKLKIKEAIVVEGRYDKNTLSQVVDAVIIETSGFSIFSNKGLIIFTDSDSAGFMIRNHIKGSVDTAKIKQAYIPDVMGKEKRKRSASKEGKLGVEGMSPDVIRQALIRAGATVDADKSAERRGEPITKTDFFCMGLSGGAGSSGKRAQIIKALELPEHLSADALLDILNALYTKEEFENLTIKIFDNSGTDN